MPIGKVSEESLRHTARHVQRILWRVYRITGRKRGFLACPKAHIKRLGISEGEAYYVSHSHMSCRHEQTEHL